jgi:orotate phosphoribosyltransferase
MTEEALLKIFYKTGALLKGHFLLTSGRHSDTYFQCAKVLQYPWYTEIVCSVIADYFKPYNFDTVISPALGGMIVGQEVARQLGKKSIFAEREDKKLVLRRGFFLEKGEKVIICEDVVTTGGSIFEVIDIVTGTGAELIGTGYIVDRSNGKVIFGVPQVSTIKMDVTSYLPEDCPLCKQNIPAFKPGSRKLSY